jgi:hypothetical protein
MLGKDLNALRFEVGVLHIRFPPRSAVATKVIDDQIYRLIVLIACISQLSTQQNPRAN